MSTSKPNLVRTWAAGAPASNVVDPDTTTPGKFDAGWLAEVPPFEHFNFLQQLFSQALAHTNEQGIMVWDSATTYPIDGLAKGSDGIVYKAVLEQSNNNPVGDGGTNWEIWGNSINDLSQAYEFPTVAAYKAFTTEFPVGKVVNLLDRGAKFTVISGTGTANTFNTIASDQVSQSIDLVVDEDVKVSQFGGSAAALQAAIDYSLDNNYESILIDTLVDTTGTTLLIDKGVQYTEGGNAFARKRLDFKGAGIGEIRKTDAGFMFSATSGRNGDIGFDNITLSGDVDTPFPTIVTGLNCFDCDKLIRLSLTNCTFRNFDRVFSQVGSVSSAMQSVKNVNNTYTKNLAIMVFNQAWDVVFDGGLMEDGSKFITAIDVNSTCRNLTISNGATIEGMTDTAIELNCVNYGTAINNCYFEANLQHIQMNRFNGSVDIIGNTFFGRGSISAGNTIKCIDVAVGEQRVTVDGNMSTETNTNTILISVDEASTFNSARYNLLGSNFTLGSTLTDTPLRVLDKNNLTNDTTRGVDFGITADVSSVQGGRPLTASINEISVCANVGDAVTLLPAVSGLRQTIINNGANACDVFPNVGDNLGVGANSSVPLAAGANVTYVCYDFATNWVALT